MRNKRIVTTLFAVAATAASGASRAQTSGDVIFNGLILNTCIITIGVGGTLAVSSDLTELSSELPGGARGGSLIVTTGLGFELEVDAPTGFTLMPAGGDANTTFASLYSATGATLLTDLIAGIASPLGFGVSTVSVGASATKSSGVFPAGAYQLPVTLRCVS